MASARRVLLAWCVAELSMADGLRQRNTSAESKPGVTIVLDRGTNADIEAICAKASAAGGRCTFMGHPDQGGLPMLTVKGPQGAIAAAHDAAGSHLQSEEEDGVVGIPGGEHGIEGDGTAVLMSMDRQRKEEPDIIMTLDASATNADIEAICEKATAAGGLCKFKGHPDQGGSPMLTVHGPQAALAAAHDAAGSQLVDEEEDGMVGIPGGEHGIEGDGTDIMMMDR